MNDSITNPNLSDPDFHSIQFYQQLLAERIDFELQFADMLENIPGFIYTFKKNPDGTYCFTYASKSIHNIYGLDPDDVAGTATPFVKKIFKKDLHTVLRKFKKSERDLSSCQLEFRVEHPEKGIIWTEVRSKPFSKPDGSIYWHGVQLDINERKKTEYKLDEVYTRLKILLQAMPDMVWLKDADGHYLACNSAFEQYIGAPEEQIIGKTDYDFVNAELADLFRKRDRDAMETGAMCMNNDKWLFNVSEKRIFLLETRKVPLYNDSGKIIGVMGIGRDITEQHQNEQLLKKSRELLTEAQRIAMLGSWELDLVSEKLTWSDEIYRIFEIDPEKFEASYDAFLNAIHPDDREMVNQAYLNSVESGTFYEVQHRLQMPDGRIKYVHERGETYYNKKGKALRTLGTVQDITERKMMEAELINRERDYQNLAENSPDPIFRYDKNCRRIYVNSAVERLTGKQASELLGKSPIELIPNSTVDSVNAQRILQQVLDTGEPGDLEVEFKTVDGRHVVIHNRIVPEFDDKGLVCSALSIGRDITDRKRMEMESRRQVQFQQSLLSGMRDAGIILVVVENGHFVYTNDNHVGCKLGYTQGQLPDTVSFMELIHPDDRPRIIEMHRDRLAGKPVPTSYEIGVLGGDGSRLEYEFHVTLVPDSDPQQTLLLAMDIAERKLIENVLRFIADPGSIGNADGFLTALARFLGEELDVRYVIIDKLTDDPGIAETVALYANGGIAPNMRYALKDTPCDNVIGKNVCCYPRSVQALFPQDELLVKMQAESYAGIPLWDSTGKPIGLIAVMDDAPISDTQALTKILQLVGPRVSAELERDHNERVLKTREQEFRSLAESSPDVVIRVDRDLRIRYLNANMVEVLELGSAQEVIGRQSIEIWPDGRFNEIDALRERVVTTGEMDSVELAVPVPGGKMAYHQVISVPERDIDGHIIGTLTFGRDITAIRETERRLSGLVENLPGIAYTLRLSPEGEMSFPYVSAGVEEIYGITPEAAMGDFSAMHGLIHPDDKTGMEALFAESMRTLTPFHVEMRICPSGQPERWLDIRSDPQAKPDGCILWYGLIFDITERKRTEQELQRREREFHSLAENIPDNIARWDVEGRYLYVNPTHERTLGASYEEVIGKPIFDSHERVKAAIAQVVAGGKMIPSVRQQAMVNGVEELHDVNLVPEFDETGKLVSVLGIGRNMTDIRNMQEAIAAREREFRTLVENTKDVIVRYDRDCRRIYVNPEWERVNGLSATDVLGKSPKELSVRVKPNASEFEQMLRRVISDAKFGNFDFSWKNEKNETIYYELIAVPEFNTKGEVESVLTVARDISERKRMFQRLFSKEQQYRILTENLPDGLVRFDRNFEIMYANEAFERIAGCPREQLHGANIAQIFFMYNHNLINIKTISDLDIKESETQIISIEKDDRKPGGTYQFRVMAEKSIENQIETFILIVQDVTDQKKSEMDLQLKTTMLEEAQAIAKVGHWEFDCERLTGWFSKEALRIINKQDDWIADLKELVSMTSSEESKRLENIFMAAIKDGISRINIEYTIQVDSEIKHIRTNAEIEYHKNGLPIRIKGTNQDISEQKKYEKQLYDLAFFDPVTRVANRMYFKDILNRLLNLSNKNEVKASIMFLDIDRFKTVNDTYGHAVGDELLKTLVSRLQTCLRHQDTLARISGDEFAILLPDICKTSEVESIAVSIMESFKSPFHLDDFEIHTSVSLGIVRYPQDGIEIRDLLKRADSAMYHAKESGRNNYKFYSKKLLVFSEQKRSIETELRKAISGGHFEVAYQPQIELLPGKLVGAEALLRWHNEKFRNIGPAEFIEIAEEAGLIIEIGKWVLASACRTISGWNKNRVNAIRMAVNMSTRQFLSRDVVRSIHQTLDLTGCDPKWLELEITEGLLLADNKKVIATLNKIREMGITIAIDDFGVGYSSLAYLKKFPIDMVKIDKLFIDDITENQRSEELVKGIVSMTRSLNFNMIVEGIETESQAEILKSCGVSYAQGYLFGKPVFAPVFEKMHLGAFVQQGITSGDVHTVVQ